MRSTGSASALKADKSPRTGRKLFKNRRKTLMGLFAIAPLWGCVISTDSTATEVAVSQITSSEGVVTYVETPEELWVRGLNDAVRAARIVAKQEGSRSAIGYALTDYITINPSKLGDRMHSLFHRGMGPEADVLTLSRSIRALADEGWLLDLKSLEGDGDFLLPVVDEPLDTQATTNALDRIFTPDKPTYAKPYFVDALLTEPAYSLGDLAVVNLSNSRDRVMLHQKAGQPARQHFEANAYKQITESSVVNELVHTTLIAEYGFDIDGPAQVPDEIKQLAPDDTYNALQVHQFISDAASLAATRHAIWMMMHHVLAVSAEGVGYGVNRSNYQLSASVFNDGVRELAQRRGVDLDLTDWGKRVRRRINAKSGAAREREFEHLVGFYSNKVVALLGPEGIDELRNRHIDVAKKLVAMIRVNTDRSNL